MQWLPGTYSKGNVTLNLSADHDYGSIVQDGVILYEFNCIPELEKFLSDQPELLEVVEGMIG
jgi:hypothetical protein